ncbi:hypothetical protein SDC9_180662 [bioreactor metagenome]|uniref:Uncharacterized protein n=1 Tax=bioreactor metagenome TaxID=1076179 RepID=A0A645H2D7_9ZZZZ
MKYAPDPGGDRASAELGRQAAAEVGFSRGEFARKRPALFELLAVYTGKLDFNVAGGGLRIGDALAEAGHAANHLLFSGVYLPITWELSSSVW